jgi:sterol desaturase/sphingolipid hydroxylase (fatty acid hydroxylase superfamily)
MSKIIVFAFPVFLAAMALEIWWDRRQRSRGALARSSYAFSDTLNSLSLGLLSQVVGVLAKFIGIAVYAWVFERIALFPDADVWNHWYGWLGALLLYDLCYYWLHRAGHEVAVFWAAHVVHHQSQEYNLSTALRQTSSGGLLGWLFYLPLALLGVPPLLFGIVALAQLSQHVQMVDNTTLVQVAITHLAVIRPTMSSIIRVSSMQTGTTTI